MNIERVEHDDIASPRLCDLLGGRMGQRIAAPDHESFEREARIERRTAQRLVHGRDRSNRMAQVDAIELDLAALAWRPRSLRLLDFWCQRADHRGANRELDPRKVRLFGLPARQTLLRIVGLQN